MINKNKELKDKLNSLKSRLAEERQPKLTKIINKDRVEHLERLIEEVQNQIKL